MSEPTTLEELIQKNIEAVNRIERSIHIKSTHGDILADFVAKWCGRTIFFVIHGLFYAVWIVLNSLKLPPPFPHWDPPPFGLLTIVMSVEAIFLSAFILRSQVRERLVEEQRNMLNLQIGLLAEQETSQILQMLRTLIDRDLPDSSSAPAHLLEETTDIEIMAQYLDATANGSTQSENTDDQ